jgi:hypothetical protein
VDEIQRWAFVNTVMKIPVPLKVRNCFEDIRGVSFSDKTSAGLCTKTVVDEGLEELIRCSGLRNFWRRFKKAVNFLSSRSSIG